MRTTLVPEDFKRSVVAVPPLCRDTQWRVSRQENQRLIQHLEAGGVRILLYGGNANFYNIQLAEYAGTLDILAESAGPDTIVVPSVGPYFGTMMDQAPLLAERGFPTAMVLPTIAVSHSEGVRAAVTRFAERFGRPVVLYIKDANYITVAATRALVEEGVISWIKYAVVRPDPANDPLLRELCEVVDPNIIVSGIGEQPAVVHLPQFRLGGFTSGCVCIAPRLSMDLLAALNTGNVAEAERLRLIFHPLENLRNQHGPIPVLHDAVDQCGVANTGPILPLLAPPTDPVRTQIGPVAKSLLAANGSTRDMSR